MASPVSPVNLNTVEDLVAGGHHVRMKQLCSALLRAGFNDDMALD